MFTLNDAPSDIELAVVLTNMAYHCNITAGKICEEVMIKLIAEFGIVIFASLPDLCFSDPLVSVVPTSVRLSVRPSVCKLFTFLSSSPKPLSNINQT